MKIEDVEKLMDDSKEAIEYQNVWMQLSLRSWCLWFLENQRNVGIWTNSDWQQRGGRRIQQANWGSQCFCSYSQLNFVTKCIRSQPKHFQKFRHTQSKWRRPRQRSLQLPRRRPVPFFFQRVPLLINCLHVVTEPATETTTKVKEEKKVVILS